MATAIRVAGILLLVFLASFTGRKLVKMAQIREFLPGGEAVEKVITGKAILQDSYGPTPWVSWDDQSIEQVGPHRINLPLPVWQTLATGDTIEIRFFAGDVWPYHRKGVFASNGNFVFDLVLLGGWITGILILLYFQFRRRHAPERALPPPLPRE